MSFIPGPWESRSWTNNPLRIDIYHEGHSPIICSVLAEEVDLTTAAANAALIANAPDMYEVLAFIREALSDRDSPLSDVEQVIYRLTSKTLKKIEDRL